MRFGTMHAGAPVSSTAWRVNGSVPNCTQTRTRGSARTTGPLGPGTARSESA